MTDQGKKRLILVSSNTSGTGRLFAETAMRHGVHPILIDNSPHRFPWLREISGEFIQADVDDDDALYRVAKSLDELVGVTSSSDYYQASAARLALRLKLPGGNADALQRCRSKQEQRQRLIAAGIRQPKFAKCSTLAECTQAVQSIGLPVVIKPVDGTGSVGVSLANSEAEALEAAAALLARATNERGQSVAPSVLVEEYVVGPEFSVELWQGTAIGVTEKHLGQPPFFVEIGHTFPARLPTKTRQEVIQVAESGVAALGVTYGAAHVELRLARDGAVIIEVNSRLAGGFLPSVISLTGIDLIARVVAKAMGLPAVERVRIFLQQRFALSWPQRAAF